MRGFLMGLSVSLAFIVGCVAGSLDLVVPSARAGSEDKVIEPRSAYFCFDASDAKDVAYKANAAAARGWEMVTSTTPSSGRSVWCFRRARH